MERMWPASWRGRDARAVARTTIRSLFQHFGLHIARLEEHNRLEEYNRLLVESATQRELKQQEKERELTLLVESATQRELKLQEKERELTRARIEIATLSPENERLRAEHAFYAKRVTELEQHNRLLTETATTAVGKLQDARQTDYQILMAQQHLLAGMKDADPRFHELYEKCRPYTMTSIERLYALYKSVEY